MSGRTDGKIGNIVKKNGQTYTYGSCKPHAVTNDGAQPCEYDTNGNMTRRGSLYLKYNPEDRMAKASSGSDGLAYIARFGLDGDGRRVKRVDNHGTIHYVGPHYERNVGEGADTTGGRHEVLLRADGKDEAADRLQDGQHGVLRGSSTTWGGTLPVIATAGNAIDDIRYHAFGGIRSGGTNTPADKHSRGRRRIRTRGRMIKQGSRASLGA